jgi:hypothetical protein
MIPQFGVAFDPVRSLVTRIIHIDQSPTDSEDNVKKALREHCPPGSQMIFIPEHQCANMAIILAGLGVKMTADPPHAV